MPRGGWPAAGRGVVAAVAQRRRGIAARRSARGRAGRSKAPASDAPAVPRIDRLVLALGAGCAGAAGILYVLTAAREIVVGDSPEFVTVAFTLGVAHPPGYPVMTLLGHLFSLLPLDQPAFRVNLVSVVCGAATVGIVYLTAWRLTGERWASALMALLLAVNPLFWRWSLVAEVFPLNNLLAATMIYLLVLWQERPERTRFLVLAAFVGGLGMSNHQTIVLLLPAVLFLLWRQRAVLFARPRVLGACVLACLAGLVPYVYLPWAAAHHPPLSWGSISSLDGLIGHFLRRDYGTGQLVGAAEYQGGSPVARVLALLESFGPVNGPLVLLGAVQAYRRVRWYFWFAAAAFALAGPGFVLYSNVNLSVGGILFVLERFFLLSMVITAPLIAFGIVLLAESAAAALRGRRRIAYLATAAGALAAVVGTVAIAYAGIDQSRNSVASDFANDVLATLEPNAILLAGGDESVLPISYVQAVEGNRTDVTLIMLGLLRTDWYLNQIKQRHPDLVIPFARFDGGAGTTRALVDANPGRPIGVIWAAPDDSLKTSYWYYSRGLVLRLLPMAQDVTLDEMTAENDRLLATYHSPSPEALKAGTFESAILAQYSMSAFRVGEEYEHAKLYDGARQWYERALSMNPALTVASWRLSQLPPP